MAESFDTLNWNTLEKGKPYGLLTKYELKMAGY